MIKKNCIVVSFLLELFVINIIFLFLSFDYVYVHELPYFNVLL